MSYLNPLRLHFAGKFQAAPSTVNNDITHYDNATFKPEYQKPQTTDQPNGWWNPDGDAYWRLFGCKITSAFLVDGTPATAGDPVRTYLVADSDLQVAAKIVDLDPQQQLVSQVWGMEVRITESNGNTLLRGKFETVAFNDIWDRSPSGGGDIGAGAAYQSVLSSLEWGAIENSQFLKQLHDSAKDGLLSIKFNVDAYNMNPQSADFTRGRIVGSIGPAAASEPQHFVLGRHFMAVGSAQQAFFTPQGKINFCVARVDGQAGKIYLDLGNALPSSQPGAPPTDLGALSLVCQTQDASGLVNLPLGDISYLAGGWYETTAGVVEVPANRTLSPGELQAVAANPLALLLTGADGQPDVAITESPGGLYVRADQFVFRLNPKEIAHARLYATIYGAPYAGARILSFLDPSQLQGGPGQPNPATPTNAVDFPARVETDAQGVAILPIQGKSPGNPRQYIDGQVYGIRPALEETLDFGVNYPFNQWDFISLLVWDEFRADDPITWYGSLQPIFQQYANLYPVMGRFLDLADYESVSANRRLLLLAFGLLMEDPNSMPVTRDLSSAKREAILHWLKNRGADGKPLKGIPPPAHAPMAFEAAAATGAAAAAEADRRGGKSAAASRRLVLRRR
jgi:hypothetical protein